MGEGELLHQAERAEQWVRDNHPKVGRTNPSSWRRPIQQDGEGGSSSKPVVSTNPASLQLQEVSKAISTASKEASKSDSSAFSTARTRDIECYKCKGRGHMKKDCLNSRQVLLVQEGYASESDNDDADHKKESSKDSDIEVVYCDPEVGPMLMTYKVNGDNTLIVEKGQRRGVFQTQCMIKGKWCKLMIDEGSYNNVISKDMVDALSLTTWHRPKPYYMQWLHNVCKLKVTHKVSVPFSIDGYEDKVECDVVTMHICHILLGRPWQFDRNVTHQERANRFTLMYRDVFHSLLPKRNDEINSNIVIKNKDLLKNTSKPRTVSLEGGGDDAGIPTTSSDIPMTSSVRIHRDKRKPVAR